MSVGLTPNEGQLFFEDFRLRGELDLEVAFDAVLFQRRRLAHLVVGVAEHFQDVDLQPVSVRPRACAPIRLPSSSITVGGVIQFSGL